MDWNYNKYRIFISRFFKWLYNPDLSEYTPISENSITIVIRVTGLDNTPGSNNVSEIHQLYEDHDQQIDFTRSTYICVRYNEGQFTSCF